MQNVTRDMIEHQKQKKSIFESLTFNSLTHSLTLYSKKTCLHSLTLHASKFRSIHSHIPKLPTLYQKYSRSILVKIH